MIIKTLVENTVISNDYQGEHGLSLYIETGAFKILFDVGASNLFLKNAKKLNVNIDTVDYLIISHGHNDHGGGLLHFLEHNDQAEIFIHQQAFENYYSLRKKNNPKFIGLDKKLIKHQAINLVSDKYFISQGIEVFSEITQSKPLPISNRNLFWELEGNLVQDQFAHEQNLIIEEAGRLVLLTGCAHNGIINIINHFYSLKGCMPDYIIGGFHLSSHSQGQQESFETIEEIANFLLGTKAQCYTCHCTGQDPYQRLKVIMGDQINYLSTGSMLEL